MNVNVNGCLPLYIPCTGIKEAQKGPQQIELLTDHLDKEAAIVNGHSLSLNFYVHLDKHLDLVQMADEQSFTICCRDGSQWASTAIFISAQRDKEKH